MKYGVLITEDDIIPIIRRGKLWRRLYQLRHRNAYGAPVQTAGREIIPFRTMVELSAYMRMIGKSTPNYQA